MAKSSETMGQKKLDRLNRISYNATDFMDQQENFRKGNEDQASPSDNTASNEDFNLMELDSITILGSDPLGGHSLRSQSIPRHEESDTCFSQSLHQENDSYNHMITPDTNVRRLDYREPYRVAWGAEATSYVKDGLSPRRRRIHNSDLSNLKDERQGSPFLNSNDVEPYPYQYSVTPDTTTRQESSFNEFYTESWSQQRIYEDERHVHTYPRSNHDLRINARMKYEEHEQFSRNKLEADMFHSYATRDSASLPREAKMSFAAKMGYAVKMSSKNHYPTSKASMPINQRPPAEQKAIISESRGNSFMRPSETSKMDKKPSVILQGIKKIVHRKKSASKASSDESWISESDITDNDVICERGGRSNRHAGTKKYRGIVEKEKMKYQSLTIKRNKTDLSREIIAQIQETNGRFLKKDKKSGKYFVLSKVETTKKVSQALREKKVLKWTEGSDEGIVEQL